MCVYVCMSHVYICPWSLEECTGSSGARLLVVSHIMRVVGIEPGSSEKTAVSAVELSLLPQ